MNLSIRPNIHLNLVSLHSAPRSGSTWVQNIFESHPCIITKFQPLFCYEFKNIIHKNSTKNDFNNFIYNIYHSENDFLNMTSDFHKECKAKIPKFSKQTINTMLMKNVHHNHLIKTFIKLCPNIKIIGLVRNPCAVINSFIENKREYKKEWIGTNEWLTGHQKNIGEEHFFGYNKWKEVIDIFESIKQSCPNNIIIVRFEDILDDPQKEITKLTSFIGICAHENMFNFIEKSHTGTGQTSNYSVIKNKSVKDKWKKTLNPHIIDYIKKDIKNTKYEKYF